MLIRPGFTTMLHEGHFNPRMVVVAQ